MADLHARVAALEAQAAEQCAANARSVQLMGSTKEDMSRIYAMMLQIMEAIDNLPTEGATVEALLEGACKSQVARQSSCRSDVNQGGHTIYMPMPSEQTIWPVSLSCDGPPEGEYSSPWGKAGDLKQAIANVEELIIRGREQPSFAWAATTSPNKLRARSPTPLLSSVAAPCSPQSPAARNRSVDFGRESPMVANSLMPSFGQRFPVTPKQKDRPVMPDGATSPLQQAVQFAAPRPKSPRASAPSSAVISSRPAASPTASPSLANRRAMSPSIARLSPTSSPAKKLQHTATFSPSKGGLAWLPQTILRPAQDGSPSATAAVLLAEQTSGLSPSPRSPYSNRSLHLRALSPAVSFDAAVAIAGTGSPSRSRIPFRASSPPAHSRPGFMQDLCSPVNAADALS